MKNYYSLLMGLVLLLVSALNVQSQNIETCCSYSASMWFNDGITIDTVTGYQTNDIYEVIINGDLQPLNYPYNIGSFTDMDALVADLNALGFNVDYVVNSPTQPSFTYEVVLNLDASTGNVLDAVTVYYVPTDITSNTACCAPVEECCSYTAGMWYSNSVVIDPVTGYRTNDIYEVIVDGQVLALDYPYNTSSQAQMNNLMDDLLALGINATYEFVNNPSQPSSYQIFIRVSADQGYVLNDVKVFCVQVTMVSDFTCCEIPEQAPIQECCRYVIDICYYTNSTYDSSTGWSANDITDVTINGQVLDLNYPYNLNNLNDVNQFVADMQALGYNVTYFYPASQPSIGGQIYFYIDATNNVVVNDFNVYCVEPVITSDVSCCQVAQLVDPYQYLEIDNVWLEGLYDEESNDMDWETTELPGAIGVSLNTSFLPKNQPFNCEPWNYEGEESLDFVNPFLRDWCLVTVRDLADNIIERKACLVGINGKVYNNKCNQKLKFNNLPSEDFKISVHHKSHLAFGKKVKCNNEEYSNKVDFDKYDEVYDNSQCKEKYGKKMQYCGDFDCNGIVNNLDFNCWKEFSSLVNNYVNFDADCNGIVNNKDYNLWSCNKSKVGCDWVQEQQ